jgi:ankyrin repeat protein
LVAPPPFTKEPQVISVTDSRLAYLKLIEGTLENNMSASIESRITHCRRILTERISRSGYEVDTLWAFSFLRKLYSQARKLAEQDALQKEFEKLFISDAKKKSLDTTGLDAVHLAALTGSTSVLEFLVKSGCPIDQAASPEASEYDNWTALHFAVSMGEIAAIKWLLEKGADTSAITARFQTPLHIAISEFYQPELSKVNDLVELLLPSLLQKPALNFEDDSGMTALDLAKLRSLGNTVLLLTQYGATENPRIEVSKNYFFKRYCILTASLEVKTRSGRCCEDRQCGSSSKTFAANPFLESPYNSKSRELATFSC